MAVLWLLLLSQPDLQANLSQHVKCTAIEEGQLHMHIDWMVAVMARSICHPECDSAPSVLTWVCLPWLKVKQLQEVHLLSSCQPPFSASAVVRELIAVPAVGPWLYSCE